MHTLVIAEAGQNHNGKLELAIELIRRAKEAGADIVKFQTSNARLMTSRFAPKAEYQKRSTGSEESQQEMLERIHLKQQDFLVLKQECDRIGITFLSTPFELESVAFLKDFDMPFWKIPSGEITNYPYLAAIAKTGKPVVMSTGMCEIREIENAVEVLKKNGAGEISLLHCNTEYPTPYEDVNLKAMLTLKDHFGLRVGYSDHTPGIEVSVAAVALGAEIIEKHFTLDRNMEGPDHKASLEPDEMTAMIRSIRHIEQAMGDGRKRVSDSERKNIAVARKSIVASCDIKEGEFFTEHNITTKRPGTGVSPMLWDRVIGTRAMRDFAADELIELQEK